MLETDKDNITPVKWTKEFEDLRSIRVGVKSLTIVLALILFFVFLLRLIPTQDGKLSSNLLEALIGRISHSH